MHVLRPIVVAIALVALLLVATASRASQEELAPLSPPGPFRDEPDCRGSFVVDERTPMMPPCPDGLCLAVPVPDGACIPASPPSMTRGPWSEAWREWCEIHLDLDAHAAKRQASHERLYTRTKYLVIFHIFLLGWMASLPESITKWEPGTFSSDRLPEKWLESVKEGPVRDKDELYVNYVIHPYQGAAYYNIARHEGLDPWGAFWYSFLLSTVLWEYGFEAFAEPPSIQDLIVTPTVGSLLGECFFRMNRHIQNSGGRVLGSPLLGRMVRFFLNPFGRSVRWVQRDTHLLFGQGVRLGLIRFIHPLPLHQQGNPFADVEAGAEAENVTGIAFALPF